MSWQEVVEKHIQIALVGGVGAIEGRVGWPEVLLGAFLLVWMVLQLAFPDPVFG